jgi:hypothetical protein
MATFTDEQYTEWLASPTNRPVTLVVAEHSEGLVYFGTYGYTSSPTDTDKNRHFEDLLLDKIKIVESIEKATVGNIVLINDGEHADWLGYNWAGFSIKIYLGDKRWGFDNYRLIVDGRNGGISAPRTNRYQFSILDPHEALTISIGSEFVPLSFGKVFNARPKLIDAGALTYKFHDSAVSSIVVRDNGVVLTGGGVGYTADLANGEFSLVSAPAGQITLDISEVNVEPEEIIREICKRVPVADQDNRIWDIADAALNAGFNTTTTAFTTSGGAEILTIEEYSNDFELTDRQLIVDNSVTDGTFSNDVIGGNFILTVSVSGTSRGYYPVITEIGEKYIVRVDHFSGNAIGVKVGTTISGTELLAQLNISAGVNHERTFTATTAITYVNFIKGSVGTATGTNLSVEKVVGNYISVESNTTPTVNAKVKISAYPLSTVNPTTGTLVFLRGQVRHVGTGDSWSLVLSSADGLIADQVLILEIDNTMTTWQNFSISFTVNNLAGGLDHFGAIENNASNNGGVELKGLEFFDTGVSVNVAQLAAFSNSDNCGVYIPDPREAGNIIREIMLSVGGSFRFNTLSQLEIFRLDLPNSPVLTLTPDDIFAVEETGIQYRGSEAPIKKMELGYHRNWNVQSADSLAGSVAVQDREDFSTEYKYVIKSNPLGDFPLAKNKRVGTLFELEANAQTEVDRRQIIRSDKRDLYLVKSYLAPGQVKIGETITIDYPDYGFDGGIDVVVLETQRLLGRNKIDLVVWK